MKEVFLFAIALIATMPLFAQCTKVVQANNGYNVTIQLNPVSLIKPGSCSGGYNYNVNINYDVRLEGSNAPSNLWTLHGYVSCGPNAGNFFDLPNNGGTGMSTTNSNPWRNEGDCATATPESIGCNTFEIRIHGPEIPDQTVECTFALPVELLSFNYEKVSNGVLLHWETATETMNDFFTVERSFNGFTWEGIHRIDGATNSSISQKYSINDYPKTNGDLVYYRLKQTDLDGTESYSPILAVKLQEDSTSTLMAFPNPTSQLVEISGDTAFDNWTLLNAQGLNVKNQIRQISKEKGSLELDLGDLAQGYYFFHNNGKYQTIVKL